MIAISASTARAEEGVMLNPRADLGKFDDARRSIGEAMAAAETTKVERHGGDPNTFILSPLVSLCIACHDADAQQIEVKGYSDRIGVDGWPVDRSHP